MEKIVSPDQVGKLNKKEIEAAYAELHAEYNKVITEGADEAVKTQLAQQAAKIAELEGKLDQSGNDDRVEALETLIKALNEEILQFETKLKIGGTPKVVKHNGVFYKVTLPKVNVGGKIYTADDLCKPENADVVEELIEIGSGALEAQKEA